MTVCVCALVSHGVGSRGPVWVGREGVGIRGCSLKLARLVRVRQAQGLAGKGSLQSYGGESGVNWNLGRSHGFKHMHPSDLPDGPR